MVGLLGNCFPGSPATVDYLMTPGVPNDGLRQRSLRVSCHKLSSLAALGQRLPPRVRGGPRPRMRARQTVGGADEQGGGYSRLKLGEGGSYPEREGPKDR